MSKRTRKSPKIVELHTRAPQKFKVLFADFDVRYVKRLRRGDDELNGNTDADRMVVTLAVGGGSTQQRVKTYLHEALHAICLLHGIWTNTDEQEAAVRTLAPALLHFMRSNPDVVDYLMKGDDDAPHPAT